jgi:hypothetical protein
MILNQSQCLSTYIHLTLGTNQLVKVGTKRKYLKENRRKQRLHLPLPSGKNVESLHVRKNTYRSRENKEDRPYIMYDKKRHLGFATRDSKRSLVGFAQCV